MYSPAYFVARPFPLLQHPPRQMLPARLRTLTSNEMQDYLQTLAEPGSSSHECRFKLLFSYAEVRLQAACRRTLRPLPLCRPPSAPGHRAARLREVLSYQCLCNRCFQAERAICQKVSLRAGETAVEYIRKPQPRRKKRQSAISWKELWDGS